MQALLALEPQRQSVDTLQAEIRRVCGLFTIEPRPGDGGALTGGVATGRIDRFESAVVAVDGERIARDKRLVAEDPGQHLFLVLQRSGRCRMEQQGVSTPMRPGDLYLADSAFPSVFHYDGAPSRQISLHLPREEMIHRFGRSCTGGVAIDRDDPLRLAIHAVLVRAMMPGTAPPPLGEALLGLFGAYFHDRERQEAASERAANAVLSRALALIDRCGLDPRFGPADLARALDISERTLQRHFQALGETPGRRILHMRLDHARARIEAERRAGQPINIADIAFSSAFGDLSHFYRAFRSRFGVAPGALTRPVALSSNRLDA
ncbi:hypothetical protein NS226_21915 [Aureimonas ureilytica]|uniref:HTH araC/xylS-type domain-containing protein n=1 Tax=Aureimonas ureilytica TaxID=401562 RepID=A0A175R2K4_9HYPH|nr:helix-turn-helix domain-containing protein [Aureimonas ureilytica]KTQ84176.1 hypothetical protein NS226_21915 [Aureimonas ureilytica]